jgi:hypothetical protein
MTFNTAMIAAVGAAGVGLGYLLGCPAASEEEGKRKVVRASVAAAVLAMLIVARPEPLPLPLPQPPSSSMSQLSSYLSVLLKA